ncbi:MAG: GTP-binding protein [Candidatus Levybacteria bacterium]|nr:GTP-binding protein [Candidatus Levybacteria bacterium]
MVKTSKVNQTNVLVSSNFPPVVAVLGHVDHGKTTLLDAIRKTDVAKGEHGGITQKIGASSIEIAHENTIRRITFIDTPGHEAFSAMRSRGAKVADVGLLIISATDGVMPQTKESIKILKDEKIPFIVVLTKADLPDKDPQKAKNQLLKDEIVVEDLGGDVPVIEVSAKTGKNVKELLELILLVFDVKQSRIKKPSSEIGQFSAIVIESKLDQKAGPKATIVVKNGKVLLREELITEGINAKVKSLTNDKGQNLQSATIGEAVEILGFEKVPPVGGVLLKKGETAALRSQDQIAVNPTALTSAAGSPLEAPLSSLSLAEESLSLIICADTKGSLEAIEGMLPKGVNLVFKKTGEISSSDILLAKEAKAIILGFNINAKPDISLLAKTEKVPVKNYTIIYELLNDIADVIEGRKQALVEEILGKAKILATFPFEKTKVLGITVLEGRIARGDRVKLLRNEKEIGQSTITSVRQGKNIVNKVEKGQEAGVIISPILDFTIGDVLICHR